MPAVTEVCAFSPCVLREALVQLVCQLPHRCRLLQRPLYLDAQPQAFRIGLGAAVQAADIELRPLGIAGLQHHVAQVVGDHRVGGIEFIALEQGLLRVCQEAGLLQAQPLGHPGLGTLHVAGLGQGPVQPLLGLGVLLALAQQPAIVVLQVAVLGAQRHGLAQAGVRLVPVLVAHVDQGQQSIAVGGTGVGSQRLVHLLQRHIDAAGLEVGSRQFQADAGTAARVGFGGRRHRGIGDG
jgi:hypothetical protein